MEHSTLQSLNAQTIVATTRDLESFDEGRNARCVQVGDLCQVDDDGFHRLPLQHGEEPIPKGGRRVNAKMPPQAHDRASAGLIHGDLKIGRTDYAARQPISPLWQVLLGWAIV